MEQICFRTDTFYSVMIIGMMIMFWALYQVYQQEIENSQLKAQTQILSQKEKELVLAKDQAEIQAKLQQEEKESTLSNLDQIIEQKLQQTTRLPPEYAHRARARADAYSRDHFVTPVYTPTRGEPSDYYTIGYLSHEKDSDLMMKLLESHLYSGRYQYYTTHHLDPSIKIPLHVRHDERLSTGDLVEVPGYKGKFKVHIYEIEPFRYLFSPRREFFS